MKIVLSKRARPTYFDGCSDTILAYNGEIPEWEQMVMDGVNAIDQGIDNVMAFAHQAADAYVSYVTGQAARNWLFDGVSASINETSKGGYELRVDTPAGHVELFANPPLNTKKDSINITTGTSVGGTEIGTSITVKSP